MADGCPLCGRDRAPRREGQRLETVVACGGFRGGWDDDRGGRRRPLCCCRPPRRRHSLRGGPATSPPPPPPFPSPLTTIPTPQLSTVHQRRWRRKKAAPSGWRGGSARPPAAMPPEGAASAPSTGDSGQPSPPTDDGDGERLSANGQPAPSTTGGSCGFAIGRLRRRGATALTAEGSNFGAAEAATNGEYGAKGVEARAIIRLS